MMRPLLAFILALVPLTWTTGFPQRDGAGTALAEFRGVLLNEQCATRQPEWLPYADEHSIACAMLPICFLSGYYLIIDESNVLKLDRRGELLARALLQKTDKQDDFRVVIRGELEGPTLIVHAIDEAV